MRFQALVYALHILPQTVFALTIVMLVLRRRWIVGLAISFLSPALALPFARVPAAAVLQKLPLPLAVAMALATAALLAMALAWAAGERRSREATASAVLDRAAMKAVAETAAAHAGRMGEPLALLLVEVDRYDALESLYGRPAAGRVLQALGSVLQTVSNGGDMVGKMRTNEFAMLLPGFNFDEASETAARLHDAVSTMRLHEGNQSLSITVSIGVGMLRAGETSWGKMLCRADVALFCARDNGPNQVALDTGRGRRQSDFQALTARAA